jgi:succinoglycan biosynthesis transport protein ExoP
MNKENHILPAAYGSNIASDDEINLSEYLHILSVYKWAILGFAFVVTLLVSLVVFSLSPVFESTTTILIESEEENIVSIEEVYGIPGANDEYFETQNRILQSRALAEKVIDKLSIATHLEYDPDKQEPGVLNSILSFLPVESFQKEEVVSEQGIRNAIVGQFKENLSVATIRNSQLINVTFESTDPELSASVPNTLADVYIKSDLEGRLAITDKATGSLTEQLDELKLNLEKSEKALQQFRDKEKLIDVKGVDSLAAKELDELTEELVEARRNRSAAETAYRQVTALKGKPIEAYETIPAVLKDVGLQDVKRIKSEAERKVAELKKRYGPKHPKMIAANDELVTAKKSVEKQIFNVIEAVKKEYEVARAKESHLSGAMSRSKRDMSNINRKASQLIALERDVEANRNIYETFLSRYKETSAVSDIQPVNARVVDPAVIPTEPAKPKKVLIILIAFVLSLLIATMVAFLIEALDNTMENAQDVEEKLHLSVLGILPKLKIWLNKDVKVLRYYTDNNQTPFAENVRTVRSGLLLSGIDEKQKVILVTSSIPNEGKSMVAVNLAMSLGQMGQSVLLIDCDLRRPSIKKVFELDSKDVGLSHFMIGTHTLEQATHKYEKEHISVMPAGEVPPNPLEMLSAERFTKGLDVLKKKFDHIVIDSAPSVAVSDAVVLSQLVNQVIYVVKADDTPYQLAQEGIKRLQKVNAPIVGVVLNQVGPPKKSNHYSHYYGYYGYGNS